MSAKQERKINWTQFKLKNENPRESFEALSYFLFARRFGITNGLARYKNQAGLETKPCLVEGVWTGFQAKYFDSEIDQNQIIASLKNAKSKNKDLKKFLLYTNQELSESSKKGKQIGKKEKAIFDAAKAQKLDFEWFFPSHFEVSLSRPSNLDLAQLFFGFGDEFGFVKSGTSREVQTFLASAEYIDLPLMNKGEIVRTPVRSIRRSAKKTFLLVGHPGSGKSILMQKFFSEFGGLNKRTIKEMVAVLTRNEAVPMLINLKNCVSEELETIIRERQKDRNVSGRNLGFIYLLDGLDELNEERANQVLSYIKELEIDDNTKKVIISCRAGNLNRSRTHTYFPDVIEYQIADLDESHIDHFFKGKAKPDRIKTLDRLKKSNAPLVSEARDILMIRLLWDTIEKLDGDSIITDLMGLKISFLLNDPQHAKNIDELNLLDVKSEALAKLNQEISFRFQQKFQFRFPREELQKIILDTFPRCDYRGANKILSYLSNLFFEHSYLDNDPGAGPGFIYRHRRYQEFFFIQKLKIEYEKNPKVLRDLDILSAREFFENFFLPYVRKIYEKENNVTGLLDLNLIDVYLGKHSGYGVTDAYHMNSSEFVTSLVDLDSDTFDEFLSNENLQISKVLCVDIKKLKEYFSIWEKDKNNFRTNNYLSSIWTGGVGKLIEHIALFRRAGKKTVVKFLVENLKEVQKIYDDKKYLNQIDPKSRPGDPYWDNWQDWLYIRLTILGGGPKELLELVRNNYLHFSDKKDIPSTQESGKEKLVKSLFRAILLSRPAGLHSILNELDQFEFVSLLDTVRLFGFLRFFTQDKRLQGKIKKRIESENITTDEATYFVGFYKKYLEIPLTTEEQSFLKGELDRLAKEREVDWSMRDYHTKFVLLAYSLGSFTFRSLIAESNEHFRYYHERGVYAALFQAYICLLNGQSTLSEILRDFIIYVRHNNERTSQHLKYQSSVLWADLFYEASKSLKLERLLPLKVRLLEEAQVIAAWPFYSSIKEQDAKLFDKLINETELSSFENLLDKDDYQSYVNGCFTLASFFSGINKEKARFFFLKGIKEGMLRHGWRKDSIVSYQLVDALDILWRNNWESRERLIEYTNQVFNLALRVSDFTDGKGTWRGPYNVIELAAKYDIDLAMELREKLKKAKGYGVQDNLALEAILLGKVRLGISLVDLEKGMSDIRSDYNYENKLRPEAFEHKFKIYLEIANSDLYTDEERSKAFEEAYGLVERVKKEVVDYFLLDQEFRPYKILYLGFCKKYGNEENLILEEEKYPPEQAKPENDFLKKVRAAKTKSQISGVYKQLNNYKNHFVLSTEEAWNLLLEKTLKIQKNIKPFIKYLEQNSYPHTDFFTSNSRHLHIPLAIALGNPQMKPEALRHLHKNTGHGGFENMMKVYELLRDKEMARKVFVRYLQLCDFLSN
ncbi:hypothetical protein HY416_03700 [Candidatus Kaiserbacteria bacterium]|nr:hypothetical protein [Candidatus Kaiserbacteria bacterium]